MKSTILKALAVSAALAFSTFAYAIPTLQVGVPNGSGGYVANALVSSNPAETDTAFTSGNTIAVGGAYGSSADTLIGGNYLTGPDWSTFGFNNIFNGKGAVLMTSTTSALTSLTINGSGTFFTTASNLFPNNHAPLGVATSFMFFDLGDFAKIANAVVNFQGGTGSATGEVKTLTLGGTSGYDWIHFDVMALVTDAKGTRLVTGLENNPGSKDVTWKAVPEPSTTLLLGLGLLGLLMVRRARSV